MTPLILTEGNELASIVRGRSFDAYGRFPEQLISIDSRTSSSRPHYNVNVCIVIPELSYKDDFTEKVRAICAAKQTPAEIARMPVKEKTHYPFADQRMHTSLIVNMKYGLNGFPYEGHLTIAEAYKEGAYNFRLNKTLPHNAPRNVRLIRELGQRIIERDNNPYSRFSNDRVYPDKDDTINTRLMYDTNQTFGLCAIEMGIPIVGRSYNSGGGYDFCTIDGHEAKWLDFPFDKKISILEENARQIFSQQNHQKSCYPKVTKPNEPDCAVNLGLINMSRLGPHVVNYAHVDKVVRIMNYKA